MRDQIFMAKDGNTGVAIPLYRLIDEDEIGKIEGSALMVTAQKPIGYCLDCGDAATLVNAEFAEKHLEFLGDL